ncbi:hypothetical protein V8E53_000283 [Lactarius tabidus]
MLGSPVVDIRNSFGAAFIGLLVSTALLGLTAAQTWIYYRNYGERDSKPLKYFIAFVTVLDAIHTYLCTYVIYWYLVLNFGNVENLEYVMWAQSSQVPVGMTINTAVQLYYAKRVYSVSQSLICPVVIVVLVAVVVALGIFFVERGAVLNRLSSLHSLNWALCTGMTTSAVADLLIAASMCWYLFRKRTGFARTDSIITTLMAYSINSGMVTAILAGTMAITFLVSPSSLIGMAVNWVMSKCYVNSLLAMLNSRDYLRDRSAASPPSNDDGINMSSIRIDPLSDAYGTKSGPADLTVTALFHPIDVEPTFDVPKPPDASTGPLESQDQTSESMA